MKRIILSLFFLGILYGQSSNFDIVIESNVTSESFGSDVSTGDINNDGYADLLVGACSANSNQGKVYLYLGGKLMDSTPDKVFEFEGSNKFGQVLSFVGDTNNDGFEDFVVGAPGSAEAYFYYGNSDLTLITGEKLTQETTEAAFGENIEAVGDWNNDGFDDFLVGCKVGEIYLYLGGQNGLSSENTEYFSKSKQQITTDSHYGRACPLVGDINADGYDDIMVGSPTFSDEPGVDEVFIFYGGETNRNSFDKKISYDHAGFMGNESANIGDINGDGIADLIIGTKLSDVNGKALIYFGGENFDDTVDAELSEGIKYEEFGRKILPLGDLNSDGINEFAVSAMYEDVSGSKGALYIYEGSNNFSTVEKFKLTGGQNEISFGQSLASGDLDGNGIKDIIIASSDDNYGKVYIKFNGNVPKINLSNQLEFNEDQLSEVTLSFTDNDNAETYSVNISADNENVIVDNIKIENFEIKFHITVPENFNTDFNLNVELKDNSSNLYTTSNEIIPVFINPINDKLVLFYSDTLKINEGETVVVDTNYIKLTDVDTSDDSLKVNITTLPSQGDLILGSTVLTSSKNIVYSEIKAGKLSYKHNGSENFSDSFVFSPGEQNSYYTSRTINIKISPVNDDPVIDSLIAVEFNEDKQMIWLCSNWYKNVEDPDNHDTTLVFSILGENVKADFTDDKLIFESTENWFGEEIVKVVVSDGVGSDTTDLTVLVNPVNDKPVFVDVPEEIKFNTDVSFLQPIWKLVEDIEDHDSLLVYDFSVMSDSINLSYNQNTGNLSINTINYYTKNDTLTIDVMDTDSLSASIKIPIIVGFITDVEGTEEIPATFALHQNYPNPFNPTTQITYDVAESCEVTIKVLDVLGREIETLVKDEKEAGRYTETFNAQNLSSGMYLVTMKSKDYFKVMKILLVK